MFNTDAIADTGQLQMVTTGTVTSSIAGISYVGGSILVENTTTAAGDTYVNGLRFAATGALRVVDADGVNQSQGFEVDADGRLAVVTGAVGAGTFNNGVLLNSAGRAYAAIT